MSITMRRIPKRRRKRLVWKFCTILVVAIVAVSSSILYLEQLTQLQQKNRSAILALNAVPIHEDWYNNENGWDTLRTTTAYLTQELNHSARSKQFRRKVEQLRSLRNLPMHQSSNQSLPPRVFVPVERPLACFDAGPDWNTHQRQVSPATQGMIYVKPFKCASSTLAGVQIRIARNRLQRQHQRKHSSNKTTICEARFAHGPQPNPAYTLYQNVTRGPAVSNNTSFLWTFLRQPTDRAVSAFFHFQVSKRKVGIQTFRRSLQTRDPQTNRDYYLEALSLRRAYSGTNRNGESELARTTALEILNDYHFLGVVERLEESLVVLGYLLHVPLADLLFVSVKQTGRQYDPFGKNRQCTFLRSPERPVAMQHFLTTPTWRDTIQYDELLYQAVYASLDLTVESIGRGRVQRSVRKLQRALAVVADSCHPRMPCDLTGTFREKNDCLWKDSACGMECLDGVADQLNLWEPLR